MTRLQRKNKNSTREVLAMLVLAVIQVACSIRANDVLTGEQRRILACVDAIVHRHFTPERTVLVSMPSDDPGVAQHSLSMRSCTVDHSDLVELSIKSLSEKNTWNLQVSRPGFEILENSMEETDRHHNYIIFAWPGQEESDVMMNLIIEIDEIYIKGSLDPRKKFLVVIPNTGNENPAEAAVSVLKELWSKYMILDILVLVPGIVGKQLRLFTWYPNNESRGNIVLINSWEMEGDGNLLKISDIFLETIPRKFDYPPIRVATLNVEPFVIFKGSYTNHNNEKRYIFEGHEIEFLIGITKHLNIPVYFLPPPPDGTTYYDQLFSTIQKVVLGEADVGIGSLPLILHAASFADHTISHFSTGERWYVPCQKQFPRLKKVAAIFLPTTWVMLVLVSLLVVIVTWISANRSGGNECRHYRSVCSCFLHLFSVLVGVSVSDLPETSPTRLCFLLFVWFSVAISTVFQTFFTSILVDPGVVDQIRSFEEILNSGIEYGYNKDMHYYYYPNGSDLYGEKEMLKHGQNCEDYKECLLRVITKGDFATLRSEIYAEYFLTTTMPKKLKPISYLESSFKIYLVTMYITKDSPLLDPFNTIISRLLESGICDKKIHDFKRAWRYQTAPDSEKYDAESTDGSHFVLSREHLVIAFYILFFGYCSSFLTFIGESLFWFSVEKL